MILKRLNWFKLAFTFRGSVIPNILGQVYICGIFGLVISILAYFNYHVSAKPLGGLIPSIVLGLLLVFRTNTAYERFWEGRKAWGGIVTNIRNLSRSILVAVDEHELTDRAEKIQILNLLGAFAVATKLHLRSQPIDEQLAKLVSPAQALKLQTANNSPLEIAFWISDYLQAQHRQGQINLYQMSTLQILINNLVESFGTCERILRTPMPLAYAIHLKQLLMIYCLLLPFQLVDELKWLTAPAVAVVSFTLFGIEEIGVEIENPFGNDPNDLPLDNICNNIQVNIADLVDIEPHDRIRSHDSHLGEQLN